MKNKDVLNNLIKISEDSQCDCWICEVAFSAFEELTRALKEIDKLRAAGDALAECLRYWADFADQGYPDDDALRTWQEARRD
jgi:hypothetical protein